MKLQYEEIQVKLVMLSAQDVLTMSGFQGEVDSEDFGDPAGNF